MSVKSLIPSTLAQGRVMSEVSETAISPKFISADHVCTKTLYVFHRRHHAIFDFFFFGVVLSTRMDEHRLRAARALATSGSIDDTKRLEAVLADSNPAFKKLQGFSSLQSENMTIRSVDNFICFLSELIQQCMLKRPQLLKSSETVKIEDVLRFKSHRALVSYLVDKKLNELTYGGIRELEGFLKERTGTVLALDATERAKLSFAIELRNIYTHNRGIVNDIFIRRLGNLAHGYQIVRGARFHAELDQIIDLANVMVTIATRLDHSIASKFRLKRSPHSAWREASKAAPLEPSSKGEKEGWNGAARED